MTTYSNMNRTAFFMLSGLFISFFVLSYTIGFQSSIVSRSAGSLLRVLLLVAYLLVLKRKNPSIEPAAILKQGLVFAFAISLLLLLFILVCETFSLLPILEMLYEGHAQSMVILFEGSHDLDIENQQIKSGLSPTFLLIFVVVGSFICGAAVSILYYLIIKNKSKWSYH